MFARFGDDPGEPVGEPVEATARNAVGQRTTEHLQHMLGSEQRIKHPGKASPKGGERRLGLRNKMPRF